MAGSPGTVLYFAAVAAALVRGKGRLTSLDDKTLRSGFAWSRDRPGAEMLAQLFSEAIARIR